MNPEIVRTSSFVTGSFLLDGTGLIVVLKLIEWLYAKARPNNGHGKRLPLITPGEAEICRLHGEDIKTLIEFKGSATRSLDRIEAKVDRILERGGSR